MLQSEKIHALLWEDQFIAVLALLPLSGCGDDGPTAADIEEAYASRQEEWRANLIDEYGSEENVPGVEWVTSGSDADTFVVMRTGASHIITDLSSADTLDLSDWVAIQPVAIVQDGNDVIVSAALERIVCQNTTLATVQSAITGATYVLRTRIAPR